MNMSKQSTQTGHICGGCLFQSVYVLHCEVIWRALTNPRVRWVDESIRGGNRNKKKKNRYLRFEKMKFVVAFRCCAVELRGALALGDVMKGVLRVNAGCRFWW